jgi:predicted acylesterase/phospholipase RssA
MRPKNLVIGPGAMAFYLFLGKLSQIDTSDVRAISGSSAGALLALLWVVNKGDIPEILDFTLKIPIKTCMKPNIKNLLLNFGLIPIDRIQKIISTIFLKSFGKSDMTFGQLHEARPVDLYMSAFCVDRCVTEYFSWKSHPNQSITAVASASIAVPLIFSSVPIGPWRYVDGGTQEEIPALAFIGEPPHEVLALQTTAAAPRSPKNIASFVMSLFGSALRLRHKFLIQSYHIDTSKIDIFDFGADRLRLFCDGQKSHTLVNAAYNPVWSHSEERLEARLCQGNQDSQGLFVYSPINQGEGEGCSSIRCGDGGPAPASHRPPEEGNAHALRLPSSGGDDQSPQVAGEGGDQGEGGASGRCASPRSHQHADQGPPAPRQPHLQAGCQIYSRQVCEPIQD